MSAKYDHTYVIESIIKSLKSLGYQPECWSSEYIKLTLLKPCALRKDLLLWILKILGFHYSASEVKLFNDILIKKIVHDVSSLGLCKPYDINLIKGNASSESQLKFWKLIINTSLKMKYGKGLLNPSENHSLLDLVTSHHYEFSMKDDKLNLLPEDLKPLYRSFGKSIELNERIFNLKEEYSEEEKHLDTENQREPNKENEVFTELLENISFLRKENCLFLNAYESSLKPWCKFSSESPECSSRTGELASAYNEELKLLLQSVSLANKIKNSTEIMGKRMDNVKLVQQENNPSQLLEAIVSSSDL